MVAVQERPSQVQRDTGRVEGCDILYSRGFVPLVVLAVRSILKFEPVWMGAIIFVVLSRHILVFQF